MSDNRELRHTFDTIAERYDAARPAYPEALFDDLVELAGLRPGDRLLEVGCGTGKATRPLLERGYPVVCVELGAQLAAWAQRNLAGLPVEIHNEAFETWESDAAPFDLVYAATAWHWLDPDVKYRKAHALLRPGGHLAIWTAGHAFPADVDPFFTEIQEVYDAIGEGDENWPPDRPPDSVPELEASGLFDEARRRVHHWERSYSADEYLALLDTFSDHIAMGKDKRELLHREVRQRIGRRGDGRVLRHWHATLQVARRR